jgi:hypothetical protein
VSSPKRSRIVGAAADVDAVAAIAGEPVVVDDVADELAVPTNLVERHVPARRADDLQGNREYQALALRRSSGDSPGRTSVGAPPSVMATGGFEVDPNPRE